MYLIAFPFPEDLGNFWVAPKAGINPILSYVSPKLALSEQTMISANIAISVPPPRATPLTPAIIGLVNLSK